MDHVHHDRPGLIQVVEKTAHNPALRYAVSDRGFIREGCYADLMMIDPNSSTFACDEIRFTKVHGHPFQVIPLGRKSSASGYMDNRFITAKVL